MIMKGIIMKAFKDYIHQDTVRKAVTYHVERQIPLSECVFRPHSEGFYRFYEEARIQYFNGSLIIENSFDKELMKSDFGERAEYQGEEVPLDIPLCEEKDVELNKPKRGGPAKFFVYVRDPKTKNIKKVTFGQPGMPVDIDDLKARKSFAARHKCDTRNDKTKASYWSCRLPYYAKQLGLNGGGNFFW
jgi:hypothetical protein